MRTFLYIFVISAGLIFASSAYARPYLGIRPFSGSNSVSWAPNQVFNSVTRMVTGTMTDGINTLPISNSNSTLTGDSFTDGTFVEQGLTIAPDMNGFSRTLNLCPYGYTEIPGAWTPCVREIGYENWLTSAYAAATVRMGSGPTITACPYGTYNVWRWDGLTCYDVWDNPVSPITMSARTGTDYTAYVCPSNTRMYPGWGSFVCFDEWDNWSYASTVGVAAPSPVTYTGSVTLGGDVTGLSVTRACCADPGNGNYTPTPLMCPTGTYMYGVSETYSDRRGRSVTFIPQLFCGYFENPAFENTSAPVRPIGLGDGPAVCNDDEFVKGIYFSYSGANNMNWNNVGGIYCGKLAAPTTSRSSVNMAIGNESSANVSAGAGRLVRGFQGRIDMGCCRARGARQQISTMYTRLAPIGPIITLTADRPTIDSGESTVLRWNATNADSCNAPGSFSGGSTPNGRLSGNASTGILTSTQSYRVDCTGAGVTNFAQTTVTVLQPLVILSASPDRLVSGGNSTISWNVSNVNSCSIYKSGSASPWQTFTTGASRTAASSTTVRIDTQTAYTISCSNNAGNVAATSTKVVNILSSFQEF